MASRGSSFLACPLFLSYFCRGFSRWCRPLPSLRASQRQVFHLGGAPQIPTGDAAMRTPALAVGQQLFRLGQLGELAHLGEAFADAVVIPGQHVGTPEAEDEKHLDRPSANAADAV